MTFNSADLEYPLNIYSDLAAFHEENAARCYYYHSVSTVLPAEPKKTMDFLLNTYFSGKKKTLQLIDSIYKSGVPFEEAAESTGETLEAAREILYKFYRDLLYYPRYNAILSGQNDAI